MHDGTARRLVRSGAIADGSDTETDLWDVIAKSLTRGGNFAAREYLAAGGPIHYRDDDTPEHMAIKKYPDGRREPVRHHREGDVVVRRL